MRILAALVAIFACCGVASAQVVINEFVYDDSGTDDREFVELYNAGAAPVAIGDWVLESLDSAYPSDNNADYTIPTGTVLAAGDYYVLGAGTVPNVDQIVGTSNLWENSDETMLLKDQLGNIIDSVTYEGNKIDTSIYPIGFIEGQAIWGNFASIDLTGQSWARWQDGVDTNNNGADFGMRPQTPGASNSVPNALPFVDFFNATSVGSDVIGWTGSFVNPFVIDPTNPNAGPAGSHPINAIMPASPGGGNAMMMWDPAGGGNTAHLNTAAASDFELECYVYFDTSLGCSDFVSWSIGVRGTTDTFHNHPNPDPLVQPCGQSLGNTNGQTGVAWYYFADDGPTGGKLFLIDENDGGPDETVLAVIDIMPGVNDGWQRLRLVAAGDVIDANFGGTYGNPTDGTRVQALTDYTGVGTVYMGFREFVLDNNSVFPLCVDDLIVGTGTVPYSLFIHQPAPGQLQIDNRGASTGIQVNNIFTALQSCPGGPGTGPYLGLCSAQPQADFGPQLVSTTAPFVYGPGASSYTFGPVPFGLSGIDIEGVSFQLSGGVFVNTSAVSSIVTQ